MMKKFLLLAVIALTMGAESAKAQKKVEAEAEIEFTSKYIWRGEERGGASLQPGVQLSWQNAYIAAFGNIGLDKADAEELDLTIGYRFPFGLNVAVTDYWETGIEKNDVYFEYHKDRTAHTLEGNLGFSCKYFSLQAYCMFYGHDYKIKKSGGSSKGIPTDTGNKQAYSTYIELAVPFRLSGLDWTLKAGITPMESAGQQVTTELGYTRNYTYADGPACVLASLRATKTLPLRGASMPVYVELSANPYSKKMFLLGGISIKLAK